MCVRLWVAGAVDGGGRFCLGTLRAVATAVLTEACPEVIRTAVCVVTECTWGTGVDDRVVADAIDRSGGSKLKCCADGAVLVHGGPAGRFRAVVTTARASRPVRKYRTGCGRSGERHARAVRITFGAIGTATDAGAGDRAGAGTTFVDLKRTHHRCWGVYRYAPAGSGFCISKCVGDRDRRALRTRRAVCPSPRVRGATCKGSASREVCPTELVCAATARWLCAPGHRRTGRHRSRGRGARNSERRRRYIIDSNVERVGGSCTVVVRDYKRTGICRIVSDTIRRGVCDIKQIVGTERAPIACPTV